MFIHQSSRFNHFTARANEQSLINIGWTKKKVNLVLDQLERCGVLHGVQDVSKNTSIVILDIAKF